MSERNFHRRNKPTVNEKTTESTIPNVIKKRKEKSGKFPIKLIYLLILIGGLVVLYRIFSAFIFVEHTNVPINVPTLVNHTSSDRFWGTYRYEICR